MIHVRALAHVHMHPCLFVCLPVPAPAINEVTRWCNKIVATLTDLEWPIVGYDSFCCTRPRTSCTAPSPAAPLSCHTQRRPHPRCVLVDPTRYEGRQSLPVRRCPSCRAYADSVNRGTHVASTCKIEEAIGFYGRTVQPALHQVGGGVHVS
jgi:hypothetical protein